MPARILIAEDYDDNRELLRLMLESAGYAVSETRDGRELIEAALGDLPDLLLIDLSMPNLDGWATIRELRADARTRSLPCVAVTAFAADPDRERALAAGFDAYVTKPFRSADLLEAVAQILRAAPRDGRGAHADGGPQQHDGSRADALGPEGDGAQDGVPSRDGSRPRDGGPHPAPNDGAQG
jgi:two-component system cell cycle response regulator DivK